MPRRRTPDFNTRTTRDHKRAFQRRCYKRSIEAMLAYQRNREGVERSLSGSMARMQP